MEGYNNKVFECKDCRYLWGNCEQIQKECISCKSKNIVSYRDLEDYKISKKKEQEKKEEDKIKEIKKKFKRQYGQLKKDIKKIDYKGLVLKENFYPDKLYFSFSEKDSFRFLAHLWSDGEKSYFEFSKGIMGIHYSLHYLCKDDSELMNRWKEHRNALLKKQTKCEYCGQEFKEKNWATLHHKTDWRDEVINKVGEIKNSVLKGRLNVKKAVERYNKIQEGIIKNYKLLKDTCLICKRCHYIRHKEQIDAWDEIRKNKKG